MSARLALATSASMRAASTDSAARRMSSGSARSLLLTLLGEFVRPGGRAVWTATLVQAMGGIGITEKSARQAIARAGASGWIEAHRIGRETCWVLTARGRRIIDEGAQRVQSMSRTAPWDGRWLVVAISLPESHRPERIKLYRALSWAGFGNPMPGLWVNPHTEREDETHRVVEQLGLSTFTCAFAGSGLRFGLTDRQLVEKSWDLESVAAHYDLLREQFGKLRPRSDDSILFTHVKLVNAWQRVPFIDPGLPAALLPSRWRGREVAAKLESLREQWSGAAHARWDELAGAAPVL